MRLIQDPPTSWGIRIISILAALAVGALLVHLVLSFGWYASGLAALKEDERRRRQTPIRLDFGDPNTPRPDPNAPQPGAGAPRPGPDAAPTDPNRG